MSPHDPLDFICGTDWEMTACLLDSGRDPLNLAGASLQWKLDSLDGTANYLNASLGSGITVTDAGTSTILVDVSAADTASLLPGEYRDWLFVTLASGAKLPMWTGIIRVGAAPA